MPSSLIVGHCVLRQPVGLHQNLMARCDGVLVPWVRVFALWFTTKEVISASRAPIVPCLASHSQVAHGRLPCQSLTTRSI